MKTSAAMKMLGYLGGAVLMLVFLAGIWTILTLLEAWMT